MGKLAKAIEGNWTPVTVELSNDVVIESTIRKITPQIYLAAYGSIFASVAAVQNGSGKAALSTPEDTEKQVSGMKELILACYVTGVGSEEPDFSREEIDALSFSDLSELFSVAIEKGGLGEEKKAKARRFRK